VSGSYGLFVLGAPARVLTPEDVSPCWWPGAIRWSGAGLVGMTLYTAYSTSPDTLRLAPHAGGQERVSDNRIAPAGAVHIGGNARFV